MVHFQQCFHSTAYLTANVHTHCCYWYYCFGIVETREFFNSLEEKERNEKRCEVLDTSPFSVGSSGSQAVNEGWVMGDSLDLLTDKSSEETFCPPWHVRSSDHSHPRLLASNLVSIYRFLDSQPSGAMNELHILAAGQRPRWLTEQVKKHHILDSKWGPLAELTLYPVLDHNRCSKLTPTLSIFHWGQHWKNLLQVHLYLQESLLPYFPYMVDNMCSRATFLWSVWSPCPEVNPRLTLWYKCL